MTDYTRLSNTLQDTVNAHIDDILYPKDCTIVNINDDGTVDVEVVIGSELIMEDLECFGNCNVGDDGIFIPLFNDYNESVVIAKGDSYTKKETDKLIKDAIGNSIIYINK